MKQIPCLKLAVSVGHASIEKLNEIILELRCELSNQKYQNLLEGNWMSFQEAMEKPKFDYMSWTIKIRIWTTSILLTPTPTIKGKDRSLNWTLLQEIVKTIKRWWSLWKNFRTILQIYSNSIMSFWRKIRKKLLDFLTTWSKNSNNSKNP